MLSALLIASAVCLGVGGWLLYIHLLVPMILVETTLVGTMVLVILAYFVARGVLLAINIGMILGVIAPLITFSIPAHMGVVQEIGSGGLIGVLGFLQILGFDVFPIIYVVSRVVYWSNVKKESNKEGKMFLHRA